MKNIKKKVYMYNLKNEAQQKKCLHISKFLTKNKIETIRIS